jgi:hypothetical protein
MDPLTKLIWAAQAVIQENRDFRACMPADWEGDPLQDAIAELEKALKEITL